MHSLVMVVDIRNRSLGKPKKSVTQFFNSSSPIRAIKGFSAVGFPRRALFDYADADATELVP
jgi:hypothetical protein